MDKDRQKVAEARGGNRKVPEPLPLWLKISTWAIILIFLAGGLWFLVNEQTDQRRLVEETLWSIAELKANQIADWRGERYADAAILMGRRFLVESIRMFLADPSGPEKAEIIRRFKPIQERYDYADIAVVDPAKRVRLSLVDDSMGHGKGWLSAFETAVQTRQPAWTPFHIDPRSKIPHISLIVPLFSDNEKNALVGALVMICDPVQFLYPLIQSWPTPSKTAETLLIQKSGQDVLFLNELRHRENTALNLRIPLKRTDLPAAMAIAGRKGIVEGRDYRGVEVLAAILPVPDSPWYMVSKVDSSEAFAAWRFRAFMIAIFLLGGTGLVLALALVARQHNLKSHYRKLYRSEAALSQSLHQHQTTLQAIGDGVISTDAQGLVRLMNPVAEEMTGWKQEEARGLKLGEVFHVVNEETRLPVEDSAAKVLKLGTVVGLASHSLLIARDGREIPVADSGSPIRNDSGETAGVVLVFQDQTKEREYREKLLENEEKYRLLAENTADVIWTMSLDLEFLYVNPAILQMTGYEPEEWIGANLSDHCTPEQLEMMAEIITREAAKGENHAGVVFEAEILRKDKTPLPVEIHGRVIFDEENNPVRLQGTTRDITERKLAEEVRARLEEQFHQSQKLESIGRLAGGVAHDLNNLLTPIIGYGELLLESAVENDPSRGPLKEITRAGNRAKNLVGQLLAFSRKQTLQVKPLDLNALVKNFEKLLRHTLREDLAIRMHLAPSLPVVQGDPGQLEQVLINLAVNAQDAMPDGGELTIETAQVELDEAYAEEHKGVIPGPHVMLAVTDTGHGMDQETREHLFEPFFTTKETGKGTGLGLATVFGIVKQHGGNIWVYSEPDQGAAFKVYLPVPEQGGEPVELEEPRTRALPAASGRETILLVEDDERVRRLAFTILDQKGYQVFQAASGKEALALLEDHEDSLHLLLTDVVMPDINGKQLYEKVAALSPETKVLFMSGYTDNVIAHRGVLDSGIQFIQKPFSVNTLVAKVRGVLEQ